MSDKITELLYYILFYNYTDGMALHNELIKASLHPRICPVPREITSCCGMSIAIKKEEKEKTEEIISSSGIKVENIIPLERTFFIKRDKYC